MAFTKSVSQRLGSIKSFNTTDTVLCAETDHGKFGVKIFSPNIVRITATRDEKFEDFSYSVIATPEKTKLNWQDSTHQISVATSACKVVIDKNPVRISFQKLDGTIINEDDNLGISWIGDQVSCYKKLQPEERFI